MTAPQERPVAPGLGNTSARSHLILAADRQIFPSATSRRASKLISLTEAPQGVREPSDGRSHASAPERQDRAPRSRAGPTSLSRPGADTQDAACGDAHRQAGHLRRTKYIESQRGEQRTGRRVSAPEVAKARGPRWPAHHATHAHGIEPRRCRLGPQPYAAHDNEHLTVRRPAKKRTAP